MRHSKILVGIITLGCDKNTVDNEYLAGLLEDAGCEVVAAEGIEDSQTFDAVVLTTCGFILDAKRQSVQKMLELAENKREKGNPRRLYVAGCLSQRYIEDLRTEVPEVDGWAGVGQFQALADMILTDISDKVGSSSCSTGNKACFRPSPILVEQELDPTEARQHPHSIVNPVATVDIRKPLPRLRLTDKPCSFLKIADGCSHHCTFCSIPLMKGKLRSVPPDILMQEAQSLLKQGIRELNLVAQDITAYGTDRWRDYRLPDLLRDLCALDGDFWIRCLYCYPGGITRRLIEVLATQPKIVPYLDIPLQHLDPEMLRRMRRPHHELNTKKLVARLREAVPNIALRTTMIVGFPGESHYAHRRMLEGMRRLTFDWLGVFQFSPEQDTPAARFHRQVGPRTREKRWHAVMELQAQITAERNAGRVGRCERVLLEDYDEAQRKWVGRSSREAPEVDGKILMEPDASFSCGRFAQVRITASDVYDVLATPCL
jgi:ribosomal protein S12 methylthiotransferase